MERRNFLTGIGAFLAAPAIVRTPGLLMPIRPLAQKVSYRYYEGPLVAPYPVVDVFMDAVNSIIPRNMLSPAEAQFVRDEMRRLALNALNHQARPSKMNDIL